MAAYQKRSGHWRAIVRRQGLPGAITATFDSKPKAQAWAREIESQLDREIYIDRREGERTTLGEALERYGREITPAKKGARQEALRVAAWGRDALAAKSLAAIRGADLARWRDDRLAAGRSSTTVRNDLSIISHLYNTAIKEWGMESLTNPVLKIKKPAPARARDRRLEEGEEQRLLEACSVVDVYWLKPLIQIALSTAMRMGEILRLEWQNIDLKRCVAHLVDTKNGDKRDVPLSSMSVKVLESLPTSINGRIFPVNQPQVEYRFKYAVAKAGIKGLRFHDLRHEATSRLFEIGLNPMEAAAVTGHRTLTMLKRYTHLRAEDLAKKLG